MSAREWTRARWPRRRTEWRWAEGLAEHTLEQRGEPGTWVAGEPRAKGTANAQAQHVEGAEVRKGMGSCRALDSGRGGSRRKAVSLTLERLSVCRATCGLLQKWPILDIF